MDSLKNAWRSFLGRFLSHPEARQQFPDPGQRRAAALDAFGRQQARCCTLAKQDVPAVERFIELLQGPLEGFWRQTLSEALDAAVERLRELEDELPTAQVDGLVLSDDSDRDEDLIILAFLASFREAARAPLPADLQAAISQASEELLRAGARSQGLEMDLSRVPAVRSAARGDLRSLLAGRIETREAEIEAQAREFLHSARARTPARPGDVTVATAEARTASFQEWLAESSRLAGLRTGEWLPAVVDQWAYRWFVVGQFFSGRQAGLTELVAVAVVDGRTTSFCLWVDGRTISVEKAQGQIDRHIQASVEGDIEALMSNWPMLESEIVQSEDRAVLRRAFARVGLPPYHFRCRTLVRWIQR